LIDSLKCFLITLAFFISVHFSVLFEFQMAFLCVHFSLSFLCNHHSSILEHRGICVADSLTLEGVTKRFVRDRDDESSMDRC
jgi:hypothetical protein